MAAGFRKGLTQRSALALLLLLIPILAYAAGNKVNVNAATATELQQVPGIDATMAVRIVARRAGNGPYKKLDDLLEIPGMTKIIMIQAGDQLEIGPAPAAQPAPIGNGGKKIDLNKATFPDLLLLPGMTPRAAKSVVDYRTSHAFQSVDELDHVPGLDKRLVVQLLNQVEVAGVPERMGGPAAPEPTETPEAPLSWVSNIEAHEAGPAATTAKVPLAPGEKIDLNQAERPDLERLPDLGTVMAQRIVDFRTKNGPFKSVDGLLQVRGFGAQRLNNLRPLLQVSLATAGADPARTPRPAATAKGIIARTTATPPAPTPVPKPTALARAILPDGRVNINVAGVPELLTLPRMTRDAANEVVAFRQKNGPFHDPHGITDVPTIGEATWSRIREKVVVAE